MEQDAKQSKAKSPWGRASLWVGIWLTPGFLQCVQEVTYVRAQGGSASTAHIALHFLPGWLPWAAFTPAVLLLARRFPFRAGRRWRAFAVHAPACLFFGALHLLLLGLFRTSFPPSPLAERDLAAWLTRALWTLHTQAEVLAYAGIVVSGHALDALRRARERELRAVRLREQLTTARLGALRSQLQPHFLFNTLNTIDVLIGEDPARAKRMLLRLSELLRSTLESDAAEQPLAVELEQLERFLDIERERFSDRLEVSLDAPRELLDLAVPSLILQPLVENALRHGIAPRARGGAVRVSARRRNGWLELAVEDDGVGLEAYGGEGIGLGNTRERLAALYGEEQELSLSAREAGGVRSQLRIPARRGEGVRG